MKTQQKTAYAKTITALLTVISISSLAYAQNPNHMQHRLGRIAKNNTSDLQSNQAMQQAHKALQEAHKIMEKALPIYEGHRARSLHLARIGSEEIMDGLKFERKGKADHDNDNVSAKVAQKVAKIQAQEKALRKYTPQEIQASNTLVQQGMALQEQALALLQQAKPEYGGERVEAVHLVQQAISEAQQALRLRS